MIQMQIRCVLFLTFLTLVGVDLLAKNPAPGGDRPVTTKRLIGAKLEYHRDDRKLIWAFTERDFVLVIGGKKAPLILLEKLTGSRDVVSRVQGSWRLDEKNDQLILCVKDVGTKDQREVKLPIHPAGLVRVNLGDYQYNVFPGEAKSVRSEPILRFKQDSKDLVVSMTMEIVDAPYVLWTHQRLIMDSDPHLEGPRRDPILDSVELSYTVIQCRDDPYVVHMRHRKKKIEVTWRLREHQKGEVPYRVVKQFNPSAGELTQLAPKLVKIAEETRKRASLAVP
jgi:hypothetical protein